MWAHQPLLQRLREYRFCVVRSSLSRQPLMTELDEHGWPGLI
jgi:hypothetical protein